MAIVHSEVKKFIVKEVVGRNKYNSKEKGSVYVSFIDFCWRKKLLIFKYICYYSDLALNY